jgi:hypothetical protein
LEFEDSGKIAMLEAWAYVLFYEGMGVKLPCSTRLSNSLIHLSVAATHYHPRWRHGHYALEKNNFLLFEIYAIVPSRRGIGVNNRNFGKILKQSGPQTHFWTEAARETGKFSVII